MSNLKSEAFVWVLKLVTMTILGALGYVLLGFEWTVMGLLIIIIVNQV